MPIRLFDSLTREIRELKPSHPDGVFRFYNCGPTVYAPAHIGNFRTFVINDVLRRLLELEFGPDKVKHVRNLTDVDDRTIAQAKKENRPLAEITQKWTDKFHADCDALNCLRPHVEPTATGHIREQVDMIECLMRNGNAYRAPDGSVYFKIGSFPGYGALSRIKERELKVTDSAFDSDHKNSVGDFALWKAYKPEEDGNVKWPGPDDAAPGRPGWHIECSAMIKKHLGETIDLHTGGVDLLFPHHENEIAQSECCNGRKFSRHWYHSEHLLVDGTTMSKSKGNYYTLGDLVEKGYSPMAVRYALLMGHPRKQLNFTLDSLHAAKQALGSIEWFRNGLDALTEGVKATTSSDLFSGVRAALSDDLNLPEALGELHSALTVGRGGLTLADATAHLTALDEILRVLGLAFKPIVPWTIPNSITALAEKRWAAKQAKDFATADALRKELAAAGWSMLDGKEGYKLEPLKK
ncbi:MAG TPA: cysteine--tRNA ligase [Opitutaceae bacterium]|nr:cysteine--tRNA ligase [Opitutaceae bacterium]